MLVVASVVIEVRMSETLALSAAEALGRGAEPSSCSEGCSFPDLYRSDRVGVSEMGLGGDIVGRGEVNVILMLWW